MTQFKEKILKFKGHILTALIALVVGVILGFVFDKPKTTFIAGETVTKYVDTCATNKIIADVTTETSTKETGGVRKGKSNTQTSTFPVEQVSVQDTDVVTTFTKSYNTGLMRMKVTATVKSKSAATGKISMEYELDTVTLQSMTTIVNTVVVAKDSVDKVPDTIIKYLPVETTKKQTWVSLGSSMSFNPKNQLSYDVGGGVRFNHTQFSLFKDPTTQFKSLDGWRVQLNQDVVRLSRK